MGSVCLDNVRKGDGVHGTAYRGDEELAEGICRSEGGSGEVVGLETGHHREGLQRC